MSTCRRKKKKITLIPPLFSLSHLHRIFVSGLVFKELSSSNEQIAPSPIAIVVLFSSQTGAPPIGTAQRFLRRRGILFPHLSDGGTASPLAARHSDLARPNSL